jgi:beta-lysine 5,6-aminomutase alpha subunit
MNGTIFKGHVQDALFNMVSIMTNQGIQLLGMLTEAIHTPLLQDRALSIENARYIFNNMRSISDEIEFKEGGMIQTRAQAVLADAAAMLKDIEQEGIMSTIEKGKFAGVKRPMNGGKGLDGVVVKDALYFNPFIELMLGKEGE